MIRARAFESPTTMCIPSLFLRGAAKVSAFALTLVFVATGVSASEPTASTATPPPTNAPAEGPTIRIKAGATTPLTDESGTKWLADQGFADGDTIDRDELAIANTKTPSLYRSERYGMSRFSQKLPNGKYVVKLHFAETYEGIEGKGQRVFSFNVEGHEFKDFDVWVKAGGPLRAYIETVPVEITDGKLDISFTTNIENPEINAIEITPAS